MIEEVLAEASVTRLAWRAHAHEVHIMAATERVVVLMTPEEKSDVTRRAAAERLSLGDYMRRQALGDCEVLGALVEELAASTERAGLALGRTLARLGESEKRMPEVEASARKRALAEFSTLDPQLFVQLLCQGLAGDASQP